jgi:fibronectin type 3 domain-containing protein
LIQPVAGFDGTVKKSRTNLRFMKMNKLSTMLASLIAVATVMQAANLTVAWNPNPSSDQVLKYSIYKADGLAGQFTKVADVTAGTSYTFTNIAPGVYRLYVTASNAWGESDASSTLETPPAKPGVVTPITFQITP